MSSPAANKYALLSESGSRILAAARQKSDRHRLRALYGAAFVAEVASWNAYVADLVNCFFRAVANPLDAAFREIHSLAAAAARTRLARFNTPNAENTRALVAECTGYDPWPDWQILSRGMNALATRNRLNEILKVRHSLAHGFAMPGYTWTQSRAGRVRLTQGSVVWTRGFFDQLVTRTDQGMKLHLKTVHGIATNW
jgi:hypothetical protein